VWFFHELLHTEDSSVHQYRGFAVLSQLVGDLKLCGGCLLDHAEASSILTLGTVRQIREHLLVVGDLLDNLLLAVFERYLTVNLSSHENL